MISDSAGNASPMLLRVLTALVNLILQGRAPLLVLPFLFGASLVSLNKKDGGGRHQLLLAVPLDVWQASVHQCR